MPCAVRCPIDNELYAHFRVGVMSRIHNEGVNMIDDKSTGERKASATMIEAFCEQFAKEEGVELEKVSWKPNIENRADVYTLSISGNNYAFSIDISYENLVDYPGGVGVGVNIINTEIRNGIRDMATA